VAPGTIARSTQSGVKDHFVPPITKFPLQLNFNPPDSTVAICVIEDKWTK